MLVEVLYVIFARRLKVDFRGGVDFVRQKMLAAQLAFRQDRASHGSQGADAARLAALMANTSGASSAASAARAHPLAVRMLAMRQKDGAAARPPVAGWIDPDWLEARCEDCECGLCFGVMVEPVSGCLEGHTYCRPCLVKELRERKRCPACRNPVTDERKLTRIRPLEGIVAKMKMWRCEHGAGDEAAPPPAAKRAKVAPAASMTVEALRKELRQRGLETAGNKPTLTARLEEDRSKGAGCGWRGRVGDLAAHLGACEWAPVKCPHGCAESPLRRDLAAHDATCGSIKVPCRGCTQQFERRVLAEHEGRWPPGRNRVPARGLQRQASTGVHARALREV